MLLPVGNCRFASCSSSCSRAPSAHGVSRWHSPCAFPGRGRRMSVWFVVVFAVLLGLLILATVLVAISLTPFGRELIDARTARIALSFVALLTIADVILVARSEPMRVDRSVLTITAIAHPTWWELRYDGFATGNEMHIPADAPVVVRCVADRRHVILMRDAKRDA